MKSLFRTMKNHMTSYHFCLKSHWIGVGKIDTGFPMGFPMKFPMESPRRWAMGCGHHWCPWRRDERPGRRAAALLITFLAWKNPRFCWFYRMFWDFRVFLGFGFLRNLSGLSRIVPDFAGFSRIVPEFPDFFSVDVSEMTDLPNGFPNFICFRLFPGFFFRIFVGIFKIYHFFPYFGRFSKLFPEFRRFFPDFWVFSLISRFVSGFYRIFQRCSGICVDVLGFSCKDIWYPVTWSIWSSYPDG